MWRVALIGLLMSLAMPGAASAVISSYERLIAAIKLQAPHFVMLLARSRKHNRILQFAPIQLNSATTTIWKRMAAST
jgi:hypothetical protein